MLHWTAWQGWNVITINHHSSPLPFFLSLSHFLSPIVVHISVDMPLYPHSDIMKRYKNNNNTKDNNNNNNKNHNWNEAHKRREKKSGDQGENENVKQHCKMGKTALSKTELAILWLLNCVFVSGDYCYYLCIFSILGECYAVLYRKMG